MLQISIKLVKQKLGMPVKLTLLCGWLTTNTGRTPDLKQRKRNSHYNLSNTPALLVEWDKSEPQPAELTVEKDSCT